MNATEKAAMQAQIRLCLIQSLSPLDAIMAQYTPALTEAQLEAVIDIRDLIARLYAALCQE
jgi:hypothetical protein